MLLTITSLVVVLGVLIFVHELGHFLVAKAVGIQVLRFSLGFGRPVLRWRRGETEYWISWIPLGGYVKMAGLEEEGMVGELEGGRADVAIDPERSFDRKPLWARMAVILAGVAMNIFLAFAIYAGLGVIVGAPRLATTQVDTVTTAFLPPGAAALSTVTHGDKIVRVNGDTVRTWQDLVERLLEAPAVTQIEVAGRSEPVVLQLPPGDTAARAQVARALVPLMPAKIGIVYPGQPAARAGLKPGDLIVRAGGDTVRSWNEMLRKIWNSPGKPLELTVVRSDSLVRLTVVPEVHTETDSGSPRPRTYGLIGALQDPPTSRERVGLGTAIVSGVEQTVGQVGAVVISVKRLLFGQASVREVGGPILIAQMSGQVARLGLDWFLNFLAFFSVSLAVLNLLPIPVLDGGHAMFLIAEAIRRKPLSPQLRMRLTQVGMLLVLGIMVLALSNDVLRFFNR
ncbi:MAG TPA: RIP metalloprotease RseP [Gemmatimonadales bacterium]|nr:RIP metalloprotease RseP [Gemmatimonadales bacterium]